MTVGSAPVLGQGEILAVCRVHALLPDPGKVGVTAIDKRPVEEPVAVRRLGLYADVQADRANHGGEDQAVYAYGQADADYWAAELGRPIEPGLFGENLRISGIEVSRAVIGERWSIGSTELEVTCPRTPCATFARRLGLDGWVKRFTQANRTGAYLRVLKPGKIQVGDTVTVVKRPDHGVTIADWFGAWHERSLVPYLAADMADRLLAAASSGELALEGDLRAQVESLA